MPRLAKLLVLLLLGAALAAPPAQAQIRIEPIPPHVKPQWTQVPNTPGVYYAPNIPTDVFRYRGQYYFFWEGYLYRGSKARGPWKNVTNVPGWFYQIDPSYFKTAQKVGTPAPGTPAAPAPTPQKEIKGPEETPETPQATTAPAPTPTPAPTPAPEKKEGAPPAPAEPAPKVM